MAEPPFRRPSAQAAAPRLRCGSSRRRAQGPGRGAALGARHLHLSGPRGAPAARPRPPLIGSPRRRPLAGAGRGAAGAAACEQSVISACSARRPFPQFPARPPPPSARQEGARGAAPAPSGGESPAGAAASPQGGLGSAPPHPPRGKGSDAAFPRETGPRHRRGCGDCGWIFPAPPARLPPPTRRAGRAREHGLHVASPAVPAGSQQLPPCRGFARPPPTQGLSAAAPPRRSSPAFSPHPAAPVPPPRLTASSRRLSPISRLFRYPWSLLPPGPPAAPVRPFGVPLPRHPRGLPPHSGTPRSPRTARGCPCRARSPAGRGRHSPVAGAEADRSTRRRRSPPAPLFSSFCSPLPIQVAAPPAPRGRGRGVAPGCSRQSPAKVCEAAANGRPAPARDRRLPRGVARVSARRARGESPAPAESVLPPPLPPRPGGSGGGGRRCLALPRA